MSGVLRGRIINHQAQQVVPGAPVPQPPPPSTDGGGGIPFDGTGGVTPVSAFIRAACLLTSNLTAPTGTGGNTGGAGGDTGATGGNASATLTSTTSFDTNRVFCRSAVGAYTGTPSGYTTTYNKGWSNVPVTLQANAALTALFVRLHDYDPTAQLNVPGTGAVIQPAARVPGITSVSTASATYQVPVPARVGLYLMDLAADAAFSHPVRIPIPFGVGTVFGIGPTTSNGAAFTSNWAYAQQGVSPPSIDATVPGKSKFGFIYSPYQATGKAVTPNTWELPGDSANSPYDSAFAAEFLRLCIQQLGVSCGMVGMTTRGATITQFQINDTASGHSYGLLRDPIIGHADGDVEMQLLYMGYNDAGLQVGRGLCFYMERRIVDALRAANSNTSPGVITCTTTILEDSYDGSSHWHYYQKARSDLAGSRANAVFLDAFDAGGSSVQGHISHLGKLREARPWYRAAMGVMGAAKGGFAQRMGPRITSATRSGTTITLTITHDPGSTALKKISWVEGDRFTATSYTDIDTTSIPDAALAWLFSVYLAGKMFRSGKLPLGGSKITLVNANTVQILLASDPGAGVALDVYYGQDFSSNDPSPGTYAKTSGIVVLADNTTDGDGINYGRLLQRTHDPVYVPAPTPAAQSITMSQPLNAVPGAWLFVKFTGTGPTLSNAGNGMFSNSVEFSTDGGATYAVPDSLVIQNDNKGYGLVRIPTNATVGSTLTLKARRVGQSTADDTKTVTVVSARTEIPDPDGNGLPNAMLANYDVMNLGTLWADNAKTQRASFLNQVRVLADGLGNAANDLVADRTDLVAAPLLLPRKVCWTNAIEDWTYERPYLQFGYDVAPDIKPQRLINTNAPAAGSMMRDCAILFVAEFTSGQGGAMAAVGRWAPPQTWDSVQNFTVYGEQTGPKFIRRENSSLNMAPVPTASNLAALNYLVMSWNDASKTMTYTSRSGTVSATNAAITSAGALWNAIFLGGGLDNNVYGNFKFVQMILFNRALSQNEANGLLSWAGTKWPWGT